jgi:hypothetical protein
MSVVPNMAWKCLSLYLKNKRKIVWSGVIVSLIETFHALSIAATLLLHLSKERSLSDDLLPPATAGDFFFAKSGMVRWLYIFNQF